MKLVFIYGPPAVGKLTVATELSKLTGYGLFHNHLTIDIGREVFPKNDVARIKLTKKLRLEVFESAAKEGASIIFTMGYLAGQHKEFVSEIVETVERNGGEVDFVQLDAPRWVLLERVEAGSRIPFQKIKTKEHLEDALSSGYGSKVNYPNNLKIDVSSLKPEEAAKQIVEHFKL